MLPQAVGISILIVSLTALANLAIAYIVLKKNPASATNKLLAALSFITAIWTVCNYLALLPGSEGIRLFWVRAVMFFTTPYGTIILLLSLAFPERTLKLNKAKAIGLIIFNVITALFAISPYMFAQLKNLPNGGFSLTPGPAIIAFAIGFMGFMTIGFIILGKKYRKSTGIIKKQLQFFILGIVVSFTLLTLTNFIAVVVFRSIQLTFLGPPFTLILLGTTAYAIIRYRFLDIRLIIVRSVAYSLLILILGFIYGCGLFLVEIVFTHEVISIGNLVFSAILALIIAFTFQPLRRSIERATDRIFYKGSYDSQELLRSLAEIMASTIYLEPLTTSLLTPLLADLRITRGAFVLLKSHDHEEIEFIESKGFDPEISIQHKDLALFMYRKNMTIFDELEEGELKNAMRNLNIFVVLPLFAQEEKVGILCLGEKSSGDIYSEQDTRLLEILQPELSVAIQNSREFEEIKKFNITLKEEIEKATKDLQDANKRLKLMDKLKDEFVSLASHELRTPMTSIKSYIWMLLDPQTSAAIGPLNDKQKQYLDRVYKSTERLVNLVNDMLSVSRIESGRLIITPKPLNIVELAKASVNDVMPTAQEHKLSLTVKEPEQPLPNVSADEERIKQVLINLIGNSLKFTPEGGSITISFAEKEGQVAVSVQDTGTGIKQEDMGKLFTKFGMVEGNYGVRPQSKGTGLGLYISKSIVELHGGHITVYSEGEGKGTTFTFTLPVAK